MSALRTGAASGVAAKYLAPKNSHRLGLIGAGWQAFFQIEAIYHSTGVKDVMVYSRNPERQKTFIREVKRKLPVQIRIASSPELVAAQ